MTDKEIQEKKSEYFERFDHEPINIEYIWDWIEELIEEVEKNIAERVEKELVSIAEETKIDGGKPYYKGYKYVTLYNLLLNRMRECVYQKEAN